MPDDIKQWNFNQAHKKNNFIIVLISQAQWRIGLAGRSGVLV